jgi:ferredoxin-NADP reductase
MPLPIIKLVEKVEVAEGTMAFHFEKPDGFEYKAGQFADYTLRNPPETDAEGNVRGFTLASAPFEPHLTATTRLRNTAFKRVLKNSSIGTEVEFDAPYGSFTLHNNVARPAVFLTGGIGITPARSIVFQADHDKTAQQTWTGETGHIDRAMLSRYVDDLATPIYYLSGPAGMVKAMRALLNDAGVDDDDIRTEEFPGY